MPRAWPARSPIVLDPNAAWRHAQAYTKEGLHGRRHACHPGMHDLGMGAPSTTIGSTRRPDMVYGHLILRSTIADHRRGKCSGEICEDP